MVLHEDSETDFHKGVRRSKESVIELLKSGATVVTMKWDYATGSWIGGSEVFYDEDTDEEYLKSHSDAAAADNIENLLRMISFDISALK